MRDLPNKFDGLKKQIGHAETVLIYGAHRIAEDTLHVLEYYEEQHKLKGFVVTDPVRNESVLCGYPVKTLLEYGEYRPDVTLIIVAMPDKFFAEVTKMIATYGEYSVYYVGGKQLAYWENSVLVEQLQYRYPKLTARQSKYEHLCIQLMVCGRMFNFMPLGAFPVTIQDMKKLSNMARENNCCFRPEDLAEVELRTKNKKNLSQCSTSSFLIYAASSVKDSVLSSEHPFHEWEKPVFGGAALSDEKPDMLRDDEGDNISVLNRQYGEMSVGYWAWKNSDADYIGLEHYRRRFALTKEKIDYIVSNDIDVILTRPRLVLPNVKTWISRVGGPHLEEIEQFIVWMCNRFSNLEEEIDRYFNGNLLYPNNMVVAKRKIYADYSNWLHSILDEINNDDSFAELHKRSRYDDYLSEMLTSFYFMQNSDNYDMVIVDYFLYA